MNVMKQAHKNVKTLLAKLTVRYKGQYASMLKLALKDAHGEYKAQCETLKTASRNLYKVIDGASPTQTVVAFITATTVDRTKMRYYANGGKVDSIKIEQVSRGYPKEELKIFA